MCMNSETVEALHAVTTELKACNSDREEWIRMRGTMNTAMLAVTEAEAELIFKNRRDAIEGKLKELGWSRTIRVEPALEKAA